MAKRRSKKDEAEHKRMVSYLWGLAWDRVDADLTTLVEVLDGRIQSDDTMRHEHRRGAPRALIAEIVESTSATETGRKIQRAAGVKGMLPEDFFGGTMLEMALERLERPERFLEPDDR